MRILEQEVWDESARVQLVVELDGEEVHGRASDEHFGLHLVDVGLGDVCPVHFSPRHRAVDPGRALRRCVPIMSGVPLSQGCSSLMTRRVLCTRCG